MHFYIFENFSPFFLEAKFPDFGIEYDCSSVMHYDDFFFGKKKGDKTITPRNTQVCTQLYVFFRFKLTFIFSFQNCDHLGGKNAQLADSDVKWLNAFYECG